MKTTPLLISLFALFGSAVLAEEPKSPPTPSAEVSGKATITIDVNGSKVTREVDLGKVTQLKSAEATFAGSIDAGKPPAATEVRTWLGVAAEDLSDDARSQLPLPGGTGLLLKEVFADGPAAQAGLETNDVAVRFDDQILTNPSQLYALVGTRKEGDVVHVTYLRKGHEATAEVKLATHAEAASTDKPTLLRRLALDILGRSPTPEEMHSLLNEDGSGVAIGTIAKALKPLILQHTATGNGATVSVTASSSVSGGEKSKAPEKRTWLGVVTEEPSGEVRAQLPLASGTGLLVRSVIADSPAAKSGLQANDVLVRWEDQILTNPNQLRTLLGTKKEGDPVHLTYLRKGQEGAVAVKLETHAEDDSRSAVQNWVGWLTSRLPQNSAKDGNAMYFLHDSSGAGQNSTTAQGQWKILVAKEGLADAKESLKQSEEYLRQLEKSLRDAHVNEQAIKETKNALTDTAVALQKTAGELEAARAHLQSELQRVTEEIKRAVEKSSSAGPGAAPQSKPTPAAPPVEKP